MVLLSPKAPIPRLEQPASAVLDCDRIDVELYRQFCRAVRRLARVQQAGCKAEGRVRSE